MDIFEIQGPVRLSGTIKVSGSKNAALPIMAGAILGAGESVIQGVPNLADITVLKDLLISLGARAERRGGDYYLDTTTIDNPVGHYDIVRKMRASICILGPLLARCGVVKVSMPGGCAIGDRPVDIHLRGLKELGAKITLENGYIVARGSARGIAGQADFSGRAVRIDGIGDRQCHDGGDAGQGHDGDRDGGVRAGGGGPGQLSQRDGGQDPGDRLAASDDRRRQAFAGRSSTA